MRRLTLVLTLFIVLICSASALATYDYTIYWYYLGSPVTNIQMLNYDCLDDGCYTLGTLRENASSGGNNNITTHYPIPAPTYGYATYWYASCLQAHEMAWTPTGDGSWVDTNSFEKSDACNSTIIEVNVPSSIDEGTPITVSTSVASPFIDVSGAPYAYPDDPAFIQNYLSL